MNIVHDDFEFKTSRFGKILKQKSLRREFGERRMKTRTKTRKEIW